MRVAALFARRTSVYFELGADCYDEDRDARTFDLACPVVAHPPCRGWGQLAHFAKPRKDERDLAWFALWAVRHCGGVLEHPITSRLWDEAGIYPGSRDEFGGLLVPIDQADWGHRAQKRTGIYCVGTTFRPRLGFCDPLVPVERMGRAERERTPPHLAIELLEAARCVQ
jgi:hypothetical protein